MSNFVQRTLSGAVYVALVVCSIIFFEQCPWLFGVLFIVVSIWALTEYHTLAGSSFLTKMAGAVLSGWLFLTAFASTLPMDTLCVNDRLICVNDRLNIGVYCLLLIVALVAQLFRQGINARSEWADLLTGQVMIALPFALSCLIVGYDKLILLALYVIIWVNDTGAYCTGSLIGKHKMFPRVSPGKTWEGLAGGVLFSLIAGYLFARLSGSETMTTGMWICLSAVIAAAGTLGDLMESLMKRTIGVKDSGSFLPGHGGVLDRFDSFLLACPAVCLVLWLIL